MQTLKVAAAQYPIDQFDDLHHYEGKIAAWVAEAAGAGAQLLVFPEYGAMELAALAGEHASDLGRAVEVVDRLLPELDSLQQSLARRHGVHILAASAPVQGGDRIFRNVARLFAPCGKIGQQEKIVMTRFERETWGIAGGGPVIVFRTDLGILGIAICYDVEFPLIARAMAEAGAEVILAPSATRTIQGYWRVRLGCQARALENQCFVVQAPALGEAPWSPTRERNVGAAGVFAPPDGAFPDDGVVKLGDMDQPGWVYADLDLAAIRQLREDGAVLNYRHWPEQGVVTGPIAEMVDLQSVVSSAA
jgi:predicted amidohydrolase